MLRDEINNALRESMKAKDVLCVSTLRLVNAAIKDRDITARGQDKEDNINDEEIIEILSKMVKQRIESAQIYEQAGRSDLALQENKEVEVIRRFLPKQLNQEESRVAIEVIIDECNATGFKDMGRVMSVLKKRYTGQMDLGWASRLVKDLLS